LNKGSWISQWAVANGDADLGRVTWICRLVLSALLTAPSHPAHGRQRIVFDYYFRDGCRACPIVVVAALAFDFDPRGRFQGSQLAHLMRIHHVPGACMPEELPPLLTEGQAETE